MNSQKHLFQLPENIHYFNGAYMSPLLLSVEEAGIAGIRRKRDPSTIRPADFFLQAEQVRSKFGQLIHAAPEQVAIIPSASYGLASAIKNIPPDSGDHAIVLSDEFPSDHDTISDWCNQHKKKLQILPAPIARENRGSIWNEQIIAAINADTCAVVMASVHWTDGTRFDLKRIGARCKEMNALFIVDGSQSVGALPIDVMDFQIDALVCVGYKWLLGPYSTGLAYYSSFFDSGTPIETAWVNKANAMDFTRLTQYTEEYKPGAARFNVGENGNFILLPMVERALDQLLEWKPSAIQDYCGTLIEPLLSVLDAAGYWIEEAGFRCNHLFGVGLPASKNRDELLQQLQANKISVSVRGDAIRVSPNVYNTAADIEAFAAVLQQ